MNATAIAGPQLMVGLVLAIFVLIVLVLLVILPIQRLTRGTDA